MIWISWNNYGIENMVKLGLDPWFMVKLGGSKTGLHHTILKQWDWYVWRSGSVLLIFLLRQRSDGVASEFARRFTNGWFLFCSSLLVPSWLPTLFWSFPKMRAPQNGWSIMGNPIYKCGGPLIFGNPEVGGLDFQPDPGEHSGGSLDEQLLWGNAPRNRFWWVIKH